MLKKLTNKLCPVNKITCIDSSGFCLNILLDLGRYYGISSGKCIIAYNDILKYVNALNSSLKDFHIDSVASTKESAERLLSAIESMHNKKYSFEVLCIAYYMKEHGSPCLVSKAEEFSASICRRLGRSPIMVQTTPLVYMNN